MALAGTPAAAAEAASNASVAEGTSDPLEHSTPAFPAYVRPASTIVFALIMAVGVVGNVLVPLVILRARDLRNSTNIFLVNLSAADLLVLLVCAPTALVEVHSPPDVWLLGEAMCKMVSFVEMTVAHASVLTILAISFERYYAICEPLRAGYVCTKARAAAICALAWLLAALFTSPMILMADYHLEEYVDGSLVPVCLTDVESQPQALFFVVSVALFFLLPLMLLVALYAAIARRLSALPGATDAPGPVSRRALRHRKQVVLMLGVVVLVFFVCLLPFRALTLWVVTVPHMVHELRETRFECYINILSACRALVYLNSAVNPIVYNLMSSKFRAGFLRLVAGRSRGARRGPRAPVSASASLRRRSTLRAVTNSSSLATSSSRSRSRSSRARRCSGGGGGGGGSGDGSGGSSGGRDEESRLLRRSAAAAATAAKAVTVVAPVGATSPSLSGCAGGRPLDAPTPAPVPARGESFV